MTLGLAVQTRALGDAQPYLGRPLDQVLEELRTAGLDLLFSSNLVRAELEVVAEPSSTDPQQILRQVLAPHGLTVREVAGRLVIVQLREAPAVTARQMKAEMAVPTLEEIWVHASRYEWMRQDPPSVQTLERQQLDRMPGVEQDVLRSLQRIPGSAASGLSAATHVRGSYEDEVLVEFDGVRLYEPFHFKDFLNLFGAIDPELIERVHMYSGGFPAQYGNRAGAVIDMVPRETAGAEHLIGSSVFYNRALSSGSHAEGRGHWLAGYRRSNVAPVLRQLDRDVGEPQFEDLLLRYARQLTPRTSVAVGFLALQDDHEMFSQDRSQIADAGYEDDAAWLRLSHGSADEPGDWALALQGAHSHLSASRSGSARRLGVSDGTLSEARVTSLDAVRFTWATRPWRSLLASGGIEATWGEASYRYAADATFEEPLASAFGRPSALTRRFSDQISGRALAPWISVRTDSAPATLEAGLRYDASSWLEGSGQLSPRISVRLNLGARTSLRASYGRFLQSQSLNELEVEERAPSFAAPESSRQLIVGVERDLSKDVRLRLEAFDRHVRGVRPRFENVLDPLVLLPEIEVDRVRIAPQASHVRGVELSVRGDPSSALSWWGSYTWSRSDDRFAVGEAARSWDQRHAMLLGVSWRRERWLLAATAGHASGWPFTELRLSGNPADQPGSFRTATLASRNRARFADRLAVDVRAEYAWPLARGRIELLAEVRNAVMQGNECCRDIEIATSGGETYQARTAERQWLGLTPIIAVNWRF